MGCRMKCVFSTLITMQNSHESRVYLGKKNVNQCKMRIDHKVLNTINRRNKHL